MRRCPLVFFAFLVLWMAGDHSLAAQNPNDNCGPRYRRDPVATNRAREAKKAQMRQRGFPARFFSLLDREQCVACVERASDAFHIMIVYNDDANAPMDSKDRRVKTHSFGWDPKSERRAREQLAAGQIKAFYIMNTAHRCDCCPEVNQDGGTPETYADWNPELEVNMSHVIEFNEPSDLGPLPQDLENPPPGWETDVPNIEQFHKPPKRQVHVICPACESLAAQWNSAAGTLDFLWDRKLSLQEGISITENAIGNRQNQIARLEYQQLFASTQSAARQQQIDFLKRVSEQQQEGIERENRQLAQVDRDIAEANARMAALMKQIQDCEARCKTTAPPPPITEKPVTAPAPATAPAAATPRDRDPVAPGAACPACQPLATRLKGLQDSRREAMDWLDDVEIQIGVVQSELRKNSATAFTGPDWLARLNETRRAQDSLWAKDAELRDDRAELMTRIKGLDARIAQTAEELAACNLKCATANTAATDEVAALKKGSGGVTGTGDSCAGPSCGEEWKECTSSGTCKPVETDCGIPGSCERPCAVGDTCVDMTNGSAWTCEGCEADTAFQLKEVDIPDTELVVPPLPRQEVRTWFNPLGLLARTLVESVQRWRGSIGPSPLLNPRDLKALEPYSSGQAAGLPAGVHMLLVDAGGSTGKTLALQILNLSGKPARLSSLPFAVEPIKQQAQQRVQQAFSRLAKAAPVRLDLSGYCVELLKAPPRPNTILRLAPRAVQQKFAPMGKVLQSAYRVRHAGLLRPDSNPAAYGDSIKQWAVWAVEQRFNEARFTDAFAAHTKKNVEAAGQQWSKQAEDVIRKVSPNRWQDIVRVLAGAGMQTPQ